MADDSANSTANQNADDLSSLRQRFERVERGLQKPRFAYGKTSLKPITIEEKKERLILVKKLVDLGMSVEQMSKFLPTWGIPAGRTKVYDYLADLRLPKKYVKNNQTEARQSHHDFYTFRSFGEIARGFAAMGERTSYLEKGTKVWQGERFRHDMKFYVGKRLYYIELQLSDLTETNWRKKLRNYVRFYKRIKKPFRVLVILDQQGSVTTIRNYAREILREMDHTQLNIFLFTRLNDLSDCNASTDRIWWTAFGSAKERVSLI